MADVPLKHHAVIAPLLLYPGSQLAKQAAACDTPCGQVHSPPAGSHTAGGGWGQGAVPAGNCKHTSKDAAAAAAMAYSS
jgi:hypothetical protein